MLLISPELSRRDRRLKGQFTDLNPRQIPAYNMVLSFNSLLRNIVIFITPFETVNQFGFSIASKQQKIQSENQGFLQTVSNSVYIMLSDLEISVFPLQLIANSR